MKTRRTRETHAEGSRDHAIFETPSDSRIARRGSTRVEPSPVVERPVGRGSHRNPEG